MGHSALQVGSSRIMKLAAMYVFDTEVKYAPRMYHAWPVLEVGRVAK
jgi:hypothetical protein